MYCSTQCIGNLIKYLPRLTQLYVYFIIIIIIILLLACLRRRLKYMGADKSLARPTFLCILYDGENISFDASLVIYIYVYICK